MRAIRRPRFLRAARIERAAGLGGVPFPAAFAAAAAGVHPHSHAWLVQRV